MGLVLGTAQLHGSLTLTLHTSVHGKRVRPQPQQELASKPCGFPAPLASSRSDSWQKKRDSIHGIHRIKKTPQTRTHPQWWQKACCIATKHRGLTAAPEPSWHTITNSSQLAAKAFLRVASLGQVLTASLHKDTFDAWHFIALNGSPNRSKGTSNLKSS